MPRYLVESFARLGVCTYMQLKGCESWLCPSHSLDLTLDPKQPDALLEMAVVLAGG